jgi:hypothetical protein
MFVYRMEGLTFKSLLSRQWVNFSPKNMMKSFIRHFYYSRRAHQFSPWAWTSTRTILKSTHIALYCITISCKVFACQ